MIRFLLLISIAVSFIVSPTAKAQDKCDLSTVIKAVTAFKASGDNQADLTSLLAIRDDISQADVVCNGMTFTGKAKKVVGPFDIKQGMYKATAKASDLMIVTPHAVKGCGQYSPQMVLSVTAANQTEEASLEVDEDCRMIMEVTTVGTWTITLEPLQ